MKRLQIPQKVVYEKFYVHEKVLGTRNCRRKLSRGRNNGRSTDMTGQILPFARPEFSVIIEMTGHFFS